MLNYVNSAFFLPTTSESSISNLKRGCARIVICKLRMDITSEKKIEMQYLKLLYFVKSRIVVLKPVIY